MYEGRVSVAQSERRERIDLRADVDCFEHSDSGSALARRHRAIEATGRTSAHRRLRASAGGSIEDPFRGNSLESARTGSRAPCRQLDRESCDVAMSKAVVRVVSVAGERSDVRLRSSVTARSSFGPNVLFRALSVMQDSEKTLPRAHADGTVAPWRRVLAAFARLGACRFPIDRSGLRIQRCRSITWSS